MKHHLKIAINFLASLFFMILGTMQTAQAEEVWLDFSVPQADIRVTAPTVVRDDEAAATASIAQRSSYRPGSSKAPTQTVLSTDPAIVIGAIQSAPSLIVTANNTEAIALKQAQKASENAAKRIALDFNVSSSAPVRAGYSAETQPSDRGLKPSVNAKVPQSPKPSLLPPSTSAIKTPATKPLRTKTRSKQVTALRRAIIGQESAGKFWIVNPDSGALGYGQLLEENVAPWTKAALGRALTPEEFLASPDLQIKTIDHKLDEYLQRALAYTGNSNEEVAVRRVASAWYSGNPQLWNDTRPQYSNGRRYPSIESYTRSVWERYLREIG